MIRRIVALVVLTLVAASCGGGDDGGDTGSDTTPAAGSEILIEFDDGEPVRDIWRQDVTLGDAVSVVVTGDRDEQVHVHGYDLYVEPDAGDTTLEFDALIPGRFETSDIHVVAGFGKAFLDITSSGFVVFDYEELHRPDSG